MQEQGSGGGSSMLRTRPNTIIRGEVQGEYVVRGAKIKCSKALKDDAYDVVNLPLCHGVYSGDEPLINIKDMKDGENIVNGFGVCSETGTACKGEMKFHINWINRKKIRLHIEGEQAVTTNSFTMCSAHGGEITFENSGQTAVYHPKNERARDEALELQGTASYLTENNSQDMVSLSNDTKHVSFGVMGTTYDSSENYVQYSDESKKEELRPKLTEAEKAINQKNVLEALQTKDVDHVKELLARRELISPDGSPYAYYKVATRQGVEYIVLFTEEQHNQGLAAGAVGVVAVASLGGAAVLATCTVEQLAVGATAYTTRLVTAPDFANDVTTFEASMADGDKVGMFIDGISLAIPYSVGGAGTAKNITEDTLEAVVKDSTSYLDDAVDVVKKGDEVIEETAEEVVEKGSKEIVEGTGNASDVFAFQKYKQSLLKGDILSNSHPIISGVDLNDTRAINALTKNGDDIADWAKMSSNAYDTPYGKGEFHFYKNQVTGEISSYDSKLKIPMPKNLWSDKMIQEYYIIDVDSNFEYLRLRN